MNGGNAFGAAPAMAAAQSRSEMMMCRIFGGDIQLIACDAKSGKVVSSNGTGRMAVMRDCGTMLREMRRISMSLIGLRGTASAAGRQPGIS